jgi:4-amino-4-deoxy-L-arabinose transferase-like glycosyltransferase
LLIVAAASALRLLGLSTMSLIGDESYYWLWSLHPAWAYYDHPAGVALLIRASTALGGSTPLGIRWLNALMGVACVVLTWLVGERLLSRRAGLLAAAAVALGAPFLIVSRFVYTNTLTLFLMLLNVLAFWRMAREDAGVADGLAFGFTLALLFNTKYSAYVYATALAAALLLDHRHLLRTPRLWVGAGVGALGLAPVVAWNVGHDWASFRWQLSHLTRAAVHHASLLGNVRHAWVYLTGPLILLGAAGLWRVRTAAERLLTLLALFLLIPIAVSPINSPRNLSTGLVPLLLLAGTRLACEAKPRATATALQRAAAVAFAPLLLGVALFGVGTVVSLGGPSPLPGSSIVPAIRRDAAGWPALGAILERESAPIFALDYSIAAQIRYYTGQPAFTAWGQYRLWGIPPLQDATVVALDYLDPELVTQRLQEAFQHVEGPDRLTFTESGATKVVYIWQARDLRWDQQTFLRRFDFLTMLEETS